MMREILFRGKRTGKPWGSLDNDGWVEATTFVRVIRDGKEHFYIGCTKGIELRFDAHGDIMEAEAEDDCLFYEVIPETVGQYTGLKDKNGKRIFEGDLLNGFSYPFLSDNAHNYFAEVVWFDNSPAFGLVTHKNPLSAVAGISAGNTDYMEDFDPTDWEVIGNIYDNPELLGGAEG